MKAKMKSRDADIRGSAAALRRAARAARRVARATGTPIYVLKAGRVVNLNRRVANGRS
jgi:hypothetical protein